MDNELEKRFSSYLIKNLKGHAHRQKIKYYKNSEITSLSDEDISKVSFSNYLQANNELENIDVNYNQPEKAFSNIKYYQAMKQIPLKQKQVLYLLAVENLTAEEVSKMLNISSKENV